ncbi:MAG: hypothetical protein RI894_347 [Bacteroidota bacterium]
MESNFLELKQQADKLRKSKNFEQATPLYGIIWTDHRDECTEWEGWCYAYCLKHLKRFDQSLTVCREIMDINPEYNNTASIYSWCLFHTQVVEATDEESLLAAANEIISKSSQDDELSPYVRTIFKVLEFLSNSRGGFPAEKINEWLNKLSPETLDSKPFMMKDKFGKPRELASKREQFYVLLARTQYEGGNYNACRATIAEAMQVFPQLHNDNETWLKRFDALSQAKKGNYAEAEALFLEIIKVKPEWYIHKELAEIYLQQGKKVEAMRAAADAALDTREPERKLSLYKFIAEMLGERGNDDAVKKHIEFIFYTRRDRKWKIDSELQAAVNIYNINQEAVIDSKFLMRPLRNLWEQLKYDGLERFNGVIKSFLPTGTAGFVETSERKTFYFLTKQFKGKPEFMVAGQEVTFYIEEGFDVKKNRPSFNAVYIKPILKRV